MKKKFIIIYYMPFCYWIFLKEDYEKVGINADHVACNWLYESNKVNKKGFHISDRGREVLAGA